MQLDDYIITPTHSPMFEFSIRLQIFVYLVQSILRYPQCYESYCDLSSSFNYLLSSSYCLKHYRQHSIRMNPTQSKGPSPNLRPRCSKSTKHSISKTQAPYTHPPSQKSPTTSKTHPPTSQSRSKPHPSPSSSSAPASPPPSRQSRPPSNATPSPPSPATATPTPNPSAA